MIVEELYKDIMNVVCETTGVSESDILHNNREECADARYLLVLALSKMLTDNEIGRFSIGLDRAYRLSGLIKRR